jgi:hypothetical protein
MGKLTKQSVFKWTRTNDHEEILYIPDHKGNLSQNHIKISFHSCQNHYHQEHKQQQILVRQQGESNPYAIQVSKTVMESSMEIPQKTKNRTMI